MLPSLGLFKTNVCPFFNNGFCERPYCHFKHAKSNVNYDRSLVTLNKYSGYAADVERSIGGSKSSKYIPPDHGQAGVSSIDILKQRKRERDAKKKAMEEEERRKQAEMELDYISDDEKIEQSQSLKSKETDNYNHCDIDERIVGSCSINKINSSNTTGSLNNIPSTSQHTAVPAAHSSHHSKARIEYDPLTHSPEMISHPAIDPNNKYIKALNKATKIKDTSSKYTSATSQKKPTTDLEYDPVINFTTDVSFVHPTDNSGGAESKHNPPEVVLEYIPTPIAKTKSDSDTVNTTDNNDITQRQRVLVTAKPSVNTGNAQSFNFVLDVSIRPKEMLKDQSKAADPTDSLTEIPTHECSSESTPEKLNDKLDECENDKGIEKENSVVDDNEDTGLEIVLPEPTDNTPVESVKEFDKDLTEEDNSVQYKPIQFLIDEAKAGDSPEKNVYNEIGKSSELPTEKTDLRTLIVDDHDYSPIVSSSDDKKGRVDEKKKHSESKSKKDSKSSSHHSSNSKSQHHSKNKDEKQKKKHGHTSQSRKPHREKNKIKKESSSSCQSGKTKHTSSSSSSSKTKLQEVNLFDVKTLATESSSSDVVFIGESSSHKKHKSTKNDKEAKTTTANDSGIVCSPRSKQLHKDLVGEPSSDSSDIEQYKKDKKKKTSADKASKINALKKLKDKLAKISEDDLEHIFEDEETYDECLKIFNESNEKTPVKKPEPTFLTDDEVVGDDDIIETIAVNNAVTVKTPVKHRRPVIVSVPTINTEVQSTSGQTAGKKRIAHRPSFAQPAKVRKVTVRPYARMAPVEVMHNRFLQQAATQLPTTVGSTSNHNSHIQQQRRMSTLPRPFIQPGISRKIPSNVRQKYLDMIIDECVQLHSADNDAYCRGLQEEQTIYDKSSSRAIYINICLNTVRKLRSIQKDNEVSKPVKTVSHEAILGGRKAVTTTFTLRRRHSGSGAQEPSPVTGQEFFDNLKRYILTTQLLIDNGYPLASPDNPGFAFFPNEPVKSPGKTNMRVCKRCGKSYQINMEGVAVQKEECSFHWGKMWTKRINGSLERYYSCCSGDVTCSIAKVHVSDNPNPIHCGYMKTLSKYEPNPDIHPGIYALDCEMCYTTEGTELTRVTVIDDELDTVYDTLVKPFNPVLDYNTRFSGISESDMSTVKTRITDVQAALLTRFSADTILIGHSLESDLKALKLIHENVVDTALVFPHRRGPPYKRALRTLMGEYLQKIIQDNVDGHDSKEDASACMNLMKWKIKHDAKGKGGTI